jgi:hypothetical protein
MIEDKGPRDGDYTPDGDDEEAKYNVEGQVAWLLHMSAIRDIFRHRNQGILGDKL